ncbi:hypothetical protein [Desulfovibrio sp. 86]|jgi:hypothetical protein|uniref:hypothetical protein n=1 Tax=Desulfovibrio sp. 86 TaxID=2666132 RepID=UPI0015D260EB|nr:hypothetical protein [Desulfovibrio sp. 86]
MDHAEVVARNGMSEGLGRPILIAAACNTTAISWKIRILPSEHFAFEILPVSTHHSVEKRGFRQNPRHFVAVAALASAEQFQSEIALKPPDLWEAVQI